LAKAVAKFGGIAIDPLPVEPVPGEDCASSDCKAAGMIVELIVLALTEPMAPSFDQRRIAALFSRLCM
jgi:hypothetical protein